MLRDDLLTRAFFGSARGVATETGASVLHSSSSSSELPVASQVALGALADLSTSEPTRSSSFNGRALELSLPISLEVSRASSSGSSTSSGGSEGNIVVGEPGAVCCTALNPPFPWHIVVNPDGTKWEGEYRKGKPYNGRGTLWKASGTREVGEWFEGGLHGLCTIIHLDGSRWEGRYLRGKPDVGHGVLLEDISGPGLVGRVTLRKEGEWVEGELSGPCTVVNHDGSKWEGEYYLGRPYWGRGTHFELCGGFFSRGEIIYGYYHGPLVFSSSSEILWEGEWRYGEPYHGRGLNVLGRGRNEGEWVYGQFVGLSANWQGELQDGRPYNGEGRWKIDDHVAYVTGRWVEGKLKGKFTTVYFNSGVWEGECLEESPERDQVILVRSDGVQARGNFVDGLLEGLCVVIKPNQTRWEGECQKGAPWNGQGSWINFDGCVVKGEWVNGALSGPCTITNKKNEIQWKGECQRGEPWNGQGTWKRSEGCQIKGEWVAGEIRGPVAVTRYEQPWEGIFAGTDLDGTSSEIEYREGKPYNGRCTIERSKRNGERVTAGYLNGELHGMMIVILPENVRCTSDWVNGSMQGPEIVTEPDGTQATRVMLDQRYHHVCINYPNGKKWEGKTSIFALTRGLNRIRGSLYGIPFEGKGFWRYTGGIAVIGRWADGKLQGEFVVIDPGTGTWKGNYYTEHLEKEQILMSRSDGAQMLARFVSGLIEGPCTISNPDGTKWEGEYRKGKIEKGKGILWNALGVKEKGRWINGRLEGLCFTTNPDGSTWEGAIRYGKTWEGQGSLWDALGIKKTGQWVDGKLVGPCLITNPDASTWEGTTTPAGSPKDGQGTWIDSSGKKMVGLWVGGRFSSGLIIHPDESIWEGITQSSGYWGDPEDGQGTWVHSSGKKMVGKWVSGRFGSGRIVNPDGSTWEGTLKKGGDPEDGQGTWIHSSGKKIVGKWVGGELDDFCIITASDGSMWEGEYRNGEPYNCRGILKTRIGPGEEDGSIQWEGEFRDGKPYTGKGFVATRTMPGITGRWEEGKIIGSITFWDFFAREGRTWEGEYLAEDDRVLVKSSDGFQILGPLEPFLEGVCMVINPDKTKWEGICKDYQPWTGEGVWMLHSKHQVGRWLEGEYTIMLPD